MKRSAIIIVIMMTLTGWTQDPSTSFTPPKKSCEQYKSLYYQYLKTKMYLDARNFWLRAYEECEKGKRDNTFFTNGTLIYRGLANVTFIDDSLHRKEVLDSIPWIYEQHLTIVQDPRLKLDYATFLLQQKSSGTTRMSELFNSVHKLKDTATARNLCFYFKNRVVNEFRPAPKDKQEDIKESLLNDYFILLGYAEVAIGKCDSILDEEKRLARISSYEEAKSYLRQFVLAVMGECESLQVILDKRFRQKQSENNLNTLEIDEGLTLLTKRSCIDSEVYVRYVEAGLKNDPSANGYSKLGVMEFSRKNYPAAISAFEKAIEIEQSDSLKGSFYYQLALSYYEQGQYVKSFSTAKMVTGEHKGKAMIICGNAIAMRIDQCGESTFDRKANYWLANDYYKKAHRLGENVEINKFSDFWPDQNACFHQNLSVGDKILLPCWKEETVVRK